ncbi:flagellar hook-associated protein FlgK [Simplicispira psychrophila]|uniref:flagellar hook-associated protein FlgK n=1 Tax=Simplicispira psychrophila TaxID=80882 RepID=UPI0004899A5F|nr:flagellar hook-associated protein FlgK [Simplicispira psychrophila]
MSLLNVGARALQANQVGLQTAGHNIANVNTPGYSRQTVSLETVQGRYTGDGYIGQGVDVQSILRNHSDLLTRQAASAAAVKAGDSVRLDRLSQLQDVFSGGPSGLGAAISDMMNAFSSVANAPTDMTARNVVLTRMEETATRLRGASERLDEISNSVSAQLGGSMTQVNALAKSIAAVNAQIVEAKGNGQSPNDLLDKRDQLIRDLNVHIQTTQIAANDGSLGVFVSASQPLVLGSTAATLSLGAPSAFPTSKTQQQLFFSMPGATQPIELNQSMLGGGTIAGLLQFQNSDLAEGQNLLGRLALGISETLNTQNKLGLTLDGKLGENLFKPLELANAVTGKDNTSPNQMGLTVADPTKLQASSYNITFTGATAGTVTRQSDGKLFDFTSLADLDTVMLGEGLKLTDGAPPPAPPTLPTAFAGAAIKDQFLLTPMQGLAGQMQAQQYSPRNLAAANAVNAAMGTTNAGSLQLASLRATGIIDATTSGLALPPSPTLPATTGGGVKLTFTVSAAGTTFMPTGNTNPPMDLSTTPPTALTPLGGPFTYTPGKPISIDGWEITLQGSPKTDDTVTVGNAKDAQYGDWYTRDAGNAGTMLALRDKVMFDGGATLSDGFASAMAQIGTRTQSALFASHLSTAIADNLEQDRTAIAGVNLDEEAARLLQYQQAYQASAKMLSIAQNIFDTLMQSVGR